MTLSFLQIKTEVIHDFPLKVLAENFTVFPIEIEAITKSEREKGLSILPLLELAQNIATEESIEFQEAVGILQGFVTEKGQEVLLKYREEISGLARNSTYSEAMGKIRVVTVFLNTRVDQTWFRENQKEIEEGLKNLPYNSALTTKTVDELNTPGTSKKLTEITRGDSRFSVIDGQLVWTIEQTKLLPQIVLDDLYAFCERQKNQGQHIEESSEVEDPGFLSRDSDGESKSP